MEKRKRSGGGGEIEVLPEALIHHIQSFLRTKAAARTSVLSKSWYSAWLTRPHLFFDERRFKDFESFAIRSKETLQRYRRLNLKIHTFKFWMESRKEVCYSVANELIVEAIKMGVIDLTFGIYPPIKFVLPTHVFESQSLARLAIGGCKIENVIRCIGGLKYLNLCKVCLQAEDLLWDIISSCPLIEGFKLYECIVEKRRRITLDHKFELHKLNVLFLDKVKLSTLFFSDLSSRFPCLKDLSVHRCFGYKKKKLHIYSQSLEFISFVHGRTILRADFDVPNLRKFCFSGEKFWPSVSFPNSCNWESHITVCCCDELSAKWFRNLNKLLLTNLSFSKVSLNFLKRCYSIQIGRAGNTRCVPKPLVENVTIDVECIDRGDLFDTLFEWCRPVYVTLNWHPKYTYVNGKRGIESLEIVYKGLMQQDGVEEVRVGVFDKKTVSGWRMLPWKSFLDASTSLLVGTEQRIRFHLR